MDAIFKAELMKLDALKDDPVGAKVEKEKALPKAAGRAPDAITASPGDLQLSANAEDEKPKAAGPAPKPKKVSPNAAGPAPKAAPKAAK